jgi:uncharacterized membrane protein
MQFGPVQMLVVAFDGNRFRGEIWPELERLKREGVVRILDLLMVRKDSTGAIAHMVASDLNWEEASAFGETMGMLAGFASGGFAGAERGALAGMAEMMDGHLFDEQDAFRLEQLLPNETTAAVVLFEHLWAAPLLAAVSRANGFEMFNEWVEPAQIMEAGGKFVAKPVADDSQERSSDLDDG